MIYNIHTVLYTTEGMKAKHRKFYQEQLKEE